jgi:hypothetical protein
MTHADTIETTDKTLGVVAANEALNMPPFAVDIVAGQGNGDVTDAVIALRGKILNDTEAQPEATVHFVACSYEESETVAVALEQWAEALRENDDANADAVRYLATRYRLVPSVHLNDATLFDAEDHNPALRKPEDLDTTSSASRQHYIDTGSYLPKGEVIES